MTQAQKDTFHAPADRLGDDEIQRQCREVAVVPILQDVLGTVPVALCVLNRQRQIVFANQAFLAAVGNRPLDSVVGKRPGEALGCIQARLMPAGCGTSEFCQKCGQVNAVLESQAGQTASGECRITVESGDALDFKVTSSPFEHGDGKYTLVYLVDCSHENRRRVMERLFFHDVLNTAGGVYGFADLLVESVPERGSTSDFARTIFKLSANVIDEIQAQRQLASAEAHELALEPTEMEAHAFIQEVAEAYRHHTVAQGRQICVEPSASLEAFTSDRVLLRRVVGNMTKNALEATNPGGTVTLRCHGSEDDVTFEVNNPSFMPKSVQLQVFRRSFSTKGQGRGLGTHSIKLLGESYLRGQVSFVTSESEGTTFRISIPRVLLPE